MTLRITLFPSLLAAFALGACEKGTESPLGDSKSMLVGKGWVQETHTVEPGFQWSPNTPPVTDYFQLNLPCDRDDILTFDSAGTYAISKGQKRCDFESSGDLTGSGTWKLDAPGGSILLDTEATVGSATWKIEALSNGQLRVSFASGPGMADGKAHTETVTYSAH